MQKFEYCNVKVALHREGTDLGPARELLTLHLPGAAPASVPVSTDLMGLLNQLGSDGWELVDFEAGVYWLKRPRKG
jgi:hypothetical protein